MEIETSKKTPILVLCVNYNNDEETARFVQNVTNLPYSPTNVIVVSNSPPKKINNLKLLNNLIGVDVVYTNNNLGYFGAARFGLTNFLNNECMPEWVIVCNTDIEITDPLFFKKLTELYNKNPPAVIGPDILLINKGARPSTRTHQNPHYLMRPSKLKMQIIAIISSNYLTYSFYNFISSIRYLILNRYVYITQYLKRHTLESDPYYVYSIFGAFIVFNRRYFDGGGTLNYGSFLFGEEIFVAETTRLLGMDIVYEPRLLLHHREHGAMNIIPTKNIAKYAGQSAMHIFKTYFKN